MQGDYQGVALTGVTSIRQTGRLFVQHSSPVVRTSIALSIVSFGLDVLGLLLGILSVWLRVRR
jgi:hypothetical protein